MEPPTHESPGPTRRAFLARARAALAPLAWLGVAVLLASALSLGLGLALGDDVLPGAWNPTWSFGEVHLPGLDGAAARALAEEGRARLPGREVETRADDGGVWLVVVGPGERLALLEEARALAAGRGHAPDAVAFGSNLARLSVRLLDDPTAALDAAGAGLPRVLAGGSLALLLVGALLRRRLARAAPRGLPRAPVKRGVLAGVLLGLGLTLLDLALSALLAAAGHPVVEQPWLVALVERGGPGLLATAAAVVLLAPLAEEVFFRGYQLEALAPAWGGTGSLVLSSACFALVHGHGPGLPVYLAYGLVLGAAARRAGTLLVPIVAHATVNGVALALLVHATA